jgi:hypothetical protein
MVSISPDYKIMYIHVTKTGGTYLQSTLSNYYDFYMYNFLCFTYKEKVYSYKTSIIDYYKNIEICRVLNLTPELIDNMIKITSVRNPYTRFISGWKFMTNTDSINKDMTLENLIGNYTVNKDSIDNEHYNHIFCTQKNQLKGSTNLRICKFENLDEEFSDIMRNLGYKIVHQNIEINKTPDYGDIFNYYNESILEFVNTNFYEDFIEYDYKIANSLDELKEILKK